MDLGLAGKAAFITGGSHGIGLAKAQALAAEGASVVVCGRNPARLAQSGFQSVQADVTDPAELGGAVGRAADLLGGLDLLVANVGGSSGGRLLDSTPQDWADTFALNVLHAAHAIRRLVELSEVADAACFVLSERGSGISGANICVDAAQDHPSAGRLF